MVPTLKPGQLVVLAGVHTLRVGDIVMVRHDGLEKIKRISQLKDGNVYLLGDNPAASTDSRDFGWVARNQVIGTLLWPRYSGEVSGASS